MDLDICRFLLFVLSMGFVHYFCVCFACFRGFAIWVHRFLGSWFLGLSRFRVFLGFGFSGFLGFRFDFEF